MGGVSWEERSRLGPLRGVIDVADEVGRRNLYMHILHTLALRGELRRVDGPKRGLDFGCGTGRLLDLLAGYCSDVYAIDREASMVEAARMYAAPYAKQIYAWTSDVLPFDDGFFDLILCSSVLSITTRELFDRSLMEMARVSSRGASLLLLEKLSIENGLSLNSYRTALTNAGFEILRAYPIRAASSWFTALVSGLTWLPAAVFPLLAATELRLMKNRTFANPSPYVQYVIAARRI